jgi:hypothetical protein
MEEKMQKNIRVKQYSLTVMTIGVFAVVGSMSAHAEVANTAAKPSQSSATSIVAPEVVAKATKIKGVKTTKTIKAAKGKAAKTNKVKVAKAAKAAKAADAMTTPDQILATSTDAPAASASSTLVAEITADKPAPPADVSVAAVVPSEKPVPAAEPTPSMVPAESDVSSALKQKSSDVTTAKNLEETFTASERQYSLSKKGSYSFIYDLGYSYYANTVLDLALDTNSSTITRLRVENNAQHAIVNSFSVQYGLRNNVTLTASLPIVAKINPPTATQTAGLGDVSVGARWEPFPLGTTPLPVTLFGSMTLPTGDSPYDINPRTDLSTGQGYYSLSGGVSTRKFIDPLVLFGTASASYGIPKTGLSQIYSSSTLVEFTPGYTTGIGFGFAYSLNYDVSLTFSYQQSFVFGSEYRFNDGRFSKPANASAATLSSSLGIRVSPKTIVNVSLGFGLTPGSPNVSLGMSLPLDFLGLGRVVK